MLILKSYNGAREEFEGNFEELVENEKYWFTDSELSSMDSEDYYYILAEHFEHDGRYLKYERIEEC